MSNEDRLESKHFMLSKLSNGVWHAKLDLTPGRHLYKFVVDGAWCADPANENRSAPNEDCVVEVYKRDHK